jgi:hypothetical protein
MRAFIGTVTFLMASLGFVGLASAHVPLWAPRVSLSLALDWNKLAVAAISRPKPPPPVRVGRHAIPKLTVTSAALPRPQLDLATYGRVEVALREVVTPHYMEPDLDHRQKFRVLYFSPYAPYLGAWGALLTIETDALLR